MNFFLKKNKQKKEKEIEKITTIHIFCNITYLILNGLNTIFT